MAGCAGTPPVAPSASAAAPAAAAASAKCLPLVVYSKVDQAELEKEYNALGPTQPMLDRVVTDFLAMRDADRACLGTSDPALSVPNF